MKCPNCHFENPPDTVYCGKCASPLKPSEEASVSQTKTLETPITRLAVGAIFAERYEILEELGRGGMGEVYRVKDQKLDEEMALKLLKPEIGIDERTIERFRNELKLARKITHKNVCRMHDFHEEQGTPFITMEHVEGEDLKSLVRRKEKISKDEAVKIAKQVCEGLTEAHRLGVIHRDLKPQNVMIDKEDHVKIMDFGIARSVEAPGVTATGMIIGTPDYISPEQAEGEEADERSDIYSLGVILYEMVTGQLPFKGETAFSVALKHKSQLPQDPRKINPDISENLSRLILICMEKDRERRYQTAELLLFDLKNLEEGFPLGTKIRPRRKAFAAALIRKKLLIPTLVVVLAIIALVIWQLLPQKEAVLAPKIENSIAVISFENMTGDESYDIYQKAIPNLLITNLENTGYLYVATWERLRDLLKQMGKKDIDFIDSDLGFELCRREGIEAIVLGSFMKAGDVFATDVKVLDVDNKRLLKSASSKGEGVDSILRTQIDELSTEISLGIGITQPTIEATQMRIAEVTTDSMEAYNFYLRGAEEFIKWYLEDARKFLEKAVEIDPNFASAYYLLGFTYEYSGLIRASKEAKTKAKTYSERVTEKERLLIEAEYAKAIEGDREKEFQILRELAEKYPKEKLAHITLGLCYRQKGLFNEAIEEYNKVLGLDPHNEIALNSLGYTYSDIGDFEKAIEYFKRFVSVYPGQAGPIASLAEMYLRMGKLDEAMAKFKEVVDIKPEIDFINFMKDTIGYIYALREDYSEAVKLAQRFIQRSFYRYWIGSYDQSFRDLDEAADLEGKKGYRRSRADTDWMKGWIYYDKGELELSRKHFKGWFDTRIENQPTRFSDHKARYSFSLGLLDLKQDRIEAAESKLEDMKSQLPPVDHRYRRNWTRLLFDFLNGEVLLAKGSYKEAISICEKAAPFQMPGFGPGTQFLGFYNVPLFRDLLARAYLKKGELDKAIAEYERILFNPKSQERWLLAHPKYYYRLAKLYEEKGLKGKAIKQYERFLELWKDADPGIAEVEDVKERLAALRSQ